MLENEVAHSLLAIGCVRPDLDTRSEESGTPAQSLGWHKKLRVSLLAQKSAKSDSGWNKHYVLVYCLCHKKGAETDRTIRRLRKSLSVCANRDYEVKVILAFSTGSAFA